MPGQSRLMTLFTIMVTVMVVGITGLLWATSSAVAAEENTSSEENQTTARANNIPMPPPIPSEEGTIVPDVTIVDSAEGRIEKYSVNGEVYMIKITPKSGPAYYITDIDGDGVLETREHALAADFHINQWMIFNW